MSETHDDIQNDLAAHDARIAAAQMDANTAQDRADSAHVAVADLDIAIKQYIQQQVQASASSLTNDIQNVEDTLTADMELKVSTEVGLISPAIDAEINRAVSEVSADRGLVDQKKVEIDAAVQNVLDDTLPLLDATQNQLNERVPAVEAALDTFKQDFPHASVQQGFDEVAVSIGSTNARIDNDYLTAADTEAAIALTEQRLSVEMGNPGNMVQNGSVRDDAKFWTVPYGDASVVWQQADDISVKPTTGSLLVTTPSDGNNTYLYSADADGAFADLPLVVEEGDTIRGTAYCRMHSSHTVPLRFRFIINGLTDAGVDGWVSSPYSEVMGNAWVKVTFDYVANKRLSERLRPHIHIEAVTGSGGEKIQFSDIDIRNVTAEVKTAANVLAASISESNAVTAKDDAETAEAAAVASKNIAAALVAQGTGVLSDQFLPWPGAGWVAWNNAPVAIPNERYAEGNTLVFDHLSTESTGMSIISDETLWTGTTGGEQYRIEVEFTLESGDTDMPGTAMIFDWRNTAGTNFRNQIALKDMVDGEVILGEPMVASVNVKKPDNFTGTLDYNRLYFMANWSGFGSGVGTKNLKVHRIQAYPLTAVEVSIQETQAAVVDLEGNALAMYGLRVGSAGLEIVSAADPINGAKSELRAHADNIVLDGTVSTNKMVISDFTDLNPDPDYKDISLWSNTGTFHKSSSGQWLTENFLKIEGDASSYTFKRGPLFRVEAGDELFISAVCSIQAGSGSASVRLEVFDDEDLTDKQDVYIPDVTFTGNYIHTKTGSVTIPSGKRWARLHYNKNGNGATEVRFGKVSIRRKNHGELYIDGSIYGNHVAGGTLTGDKIAGREIKAGLIEVDEYLDIDAQDAGVRIGKQSIADTGTDGLYMGKTDTGFGLLAGFSDSGADKFLKLTEDTFQLKDAEFLIGTGVNSTIHHTVNGTVTLTGSPNTLSLQIQGGGGGGHAGRSNTGVWGSNGSAGGQTKVELLDGSTVVKTWAAAGGAGGTQSGTYLGENATLNPYGNGGQSGKGSNTEDNRLSQYGGGGKKGAFVNVTNYDISGLSNPKLKFTMGQGGSGGGNWGEPAEDGGDGKVIYSYSGAADLPAAPIAKEASAAGTFSVTAGVSGTFPSVGSGCGLWYLSNLADDMSIGIGGGHYLKNKVNTGSMAFISKYLPWWQATSTTSKTVNYHFWPME